MIPKHSMDTKLYITYWLKNPCTLHVPVFPAAQTTEARPKTIWFGYGSIHHRKIDQKCARTCRRITRYGPGRKDVAYRHYGIKDAHAEQQSIVHCFSFGLFRQHFDNDPRRAAYRQKATDFGNNGQRDSLGVAKIEDHGIVWVTLDRKGVSSRSWSAEYIDAIGTLSGK